MARPQVRMTRSSATRGMGVFGDGGLGGGTGAVVYAQNGTEKR